MVDATSDSTPLYTASKETDTNEAVESTTATNGFNVSATVCVKLLVLVVSRHLNKRESRNPLVLINSLTDG